MSYTYLIYRWGRRASKALISNGFTAPFANRLESSDPIGGSINCLHIFPSNCRCVSRRKSTRFIMIFVGNIVLSLRLGSVASRCRIPSSTISVGMFVNNDITSNENIIYSVQFGVCGLLVEGSRAFSAASRIKRTLDNSFRTRIASVLWLGGRRWVMNNHILTSLCVLVIMAQYCSD